MSRYGFQLTEVAEDERSDWESGNGCSCHLGSAPCGSCTHPGNLHNQECNDTAWEPATIRRPMDWLEIVVNKETIDL